MFLFGSLRFLLFLMVTIITVDKSQLNSYVHTWSYGARPLSSPVQAVTAWHHTAPHSRPGYHGGAGDGEQGGVSENYMETEGGCM